MSTKKTWVDPLRRPVIAASVPASGVDIAVDPTPAELQALAAALELESIPSLSAAYRLARRSGGLITVDGRLKARVRPVCVISLEPFDLVIDEPVALRFAETTALERRKGIDEADLLTGDDPPDPVENGEIDLGRITTEFLSLALPPFPRKPGVEMAEAAGDEKASPFAALEKLKR